MNHNMKYRAAATGFSQVGVPDEEAHWYCGCNDWRFTARPNASRKTGNNFDEAERAHRLHAQAHRLIADDLAENYAEGLRIARNLTNG